MRTIEFLNLLDEQNRLRVSIQVEQGSVVTFVVRYEGIFSNRWRPIARYDTAHGFAHLDIMYADGSSEKIELANQEYDVALQIAMSDLRANWRLYRQRHEQ